MTLVQPYVSLCCIFRDNLDTFPKLLDSIRGHFDEYVFTDTGSTDGTRGLVEAFLKEHRGLVNEFEWCDDFAKARQTCYDAATGRWVMFLDTDDELVNGQNVRPLLLKTEAAHPMVEAFFIGYDYAHLEHLDTLRLTRRRDGWRWNDAIHERYEFAYPDGSQLPEHAFARTQEFHVKHKNKDPKEKERALRRNAVIAKREYETTTDPKYKARLGRTIAMEMKMDSKAEEALPLFEELYNHYKTYPEGRQAAADAAKAYQYIGEKKFPKDPEKQREYLLQGLPWAKKAGPAYEGIINYALGDYDATLAAAQRSYGRGQQTTHEGYVFEQGAIYVAAAASAIKGEKPNWPAVAERCLNHIPSNLRNDETIVAHVNGCRAKIDRITIVVPGTPQPFDENGGGGMLGGSEEAVMYLSRELARQGRNVRVFGILPPHRVPGPDKYGVDWQPYNAFNPDDECGTLVLWRAPQLLLKMMENAGKQKRPPTGVVQAYLWLHDSSLGLPPHLCKTISGGCDGAVILSDFHAKKIRQTGYQGQLHKLANGIVDEDFEPYIDDNGFSVARDTKKVIYSSCPSRGLIPLLKMWPTVKAAVPEATLDIYYDWAGIEMFQPKLWETVVAEYEKVKDLGVVHHGGVDHETLHCALRGANVWAYSHFESPEVETFCISSVKALACGATVLTVPNGALQEVTAGDAHFATDTETYCRMLISFLRDPVAVSVRREKAKRALSRYGWKKVAADFSKLWTVTNRIRLEESADPETATTPLTETNA